MAARPQTLQGKSGPPCAALIDLLSVDPTDGGQRVARQRRRGGADDALDARWCSPQEVLAIPTTPGLVVELRRMGVPL